MTINISMENITNGIKKAYSTAKNKIKMAVDYMRNHPEETVSAVAATATIATAVSKVITKHNQRKMETDLKDLYVYDRSLGHYWKLRKPLTNNQWAIINARKDAGENLGQILMSLRVLE